MTRRGEYRVERVSCRDCSVPLDYDRATFGPGGLCPLVCALSQGREVSEIGSDGRCVALVPVADTQLVLC